MQDLMDNFDFESAIAHSRPPVVGHVRRQMVRLAELEHRDCLVALNLCHCLGLRDVCVVVESEHNYTSAMVEAPLDCFEKHHVQKNSPCLHIIRLHQFDLPVDEDGVWSELGA